MTHAPIRVLIIEDNATDAVRIRRLLRETLTTSGVEVRHLDDGGDAVPVALEFEPDAIFVDYELPGRSGLEILAELGKALPLIPTIMITGVGNEGVAIDVWHAGAKDYLPKDGLTGPGLARSLFRAIALARYDASLKSAMLEASNLRAERVAVLQASGEPTLLLDRKGGIVDANAAACDALGWKQPEMVGRDFHDLVHRLRPPEIRHEATRCELEAALRQNQAIDLGPDSLCTSTGAFMPLHVCIHPISPGGEPSGWVVTARPRSVAGSSGLKNDEQPAAMQRLRVEEQERTDMLNVMGHLIQTPLTPILLHLSVLKNRDWERLDVKQQTSVQTIERNIRRIKAVFETVATVTRLQRGERALHPIPTEILATCQAMAESANQRADERYVQVHVAGAAAEALVDPDAWQSAFDHVFTLSLERTPPDGHILVQVESGDRFVDVIVTDTGPPLSPSEMRGLIDPFGFLMGDTSTGENVERALRFYVARILLESHRGQLEVLSHAQTTMFVCRLPRSPTDPADDTTLREGLRESLETAVARADSARAQSAAPAQTDA